MRLLVLGVIVALSHASAAQVFRATTTLVTVPATVTTRDFTRRIVGLSAEDFRIHEDGHEQHIRIVHQERRPVSLCIVLDASMSMRGQRQDLARASTQATIDALLPDDEVALIQFHQKVEVLVPWSRAGVRPAIDWRRYRLDEKTVLMDALSSALTMLDSARHARAAILIVSDGQELHSGASLPRLVKTRRQSEALVYGFLPDPRAQEFAGPARGNYLPTLVGDSGGVIYTLFGPPGTKVAADALLDELRYLYTIGYESTRPLDGSYRRIKVEMKDPNLRARHRAGYLAVP